MFDIDRETVIDDFYGWCSAMGNLCPVVCCHALIMLKEQEELLRKLQNDKDKLRLEVSEWKHKLKEQEAKIEHLKRPDCEHAEHDGAGRLGYCGCTQDDEPIADTPTIQSAT